MIKNPTGIRGEIITARYLRDRGYTILASNYSCRFGEIDIVAESRKEVLFVEVKTRNASAVIRPLEAVDEGKKQRLVDTASLFLKTVRLKKQPRFDVCEVWLDDSGALSKLNYIENAF